MTRPTTPAVGGTRLVPVPDPVARDYLLLALRLDQHIPGLVDAYFGPADLKAQVDMEQLRPPARLADDAAVLASRLPDDGVDPVRGRWLAANIRSLETQARALAGERLPYVDHLARCFELAPARRPDERFEAAAAELDATLAPGGTVTERLVALDDAWTVPVDRLPAVVDVLVGRFRARAETLFGLPAGEQLTVSLVRDQPWTAFNWYDGGLRSRVDLNTDLPTRLPSLVGTIAHETYPGHHLEHAWKEALVVEDQGRLEATVLTVNTPESLVSEGLANLGREIVAPLAERAELLVELAPIARVPAAGDPAGLLDAAEHAVRAAGPRAVLDEARLNAALLRHADGRSHAEVLDYLVTAGRLTPEVAAKRLQFIEHPLWRTYVFVYAEGEALLRRWLDGVSEAERPGRFGRLLRETLTPSAIAGEIGEAGRIG